MSCLVIVFALVCSSSLFACLLTNVLFSFWMDDIFRSLTIMSFLTNRYVATMARRAIFWQRWMGLLCWIYWHNPTIVCPNLSIDLMIADVYLPGLIWNFFQSARTSYAIFLWFVIFSDERGVFNSSENQDT